MNQLKKYTPSYIGKPQNNTVMYVTKKVEGLIKNLTDVNDCLIYCEDTIVIPSDLEQKHTFIKTKNPQLDYTKYVISLAQLIEQENAKRKYTLTDGGYYIGENVQIGEKSFIEPMCLIGHDVVIGKNARIYSGSKIKNCKIGDNFIANENCVIGTNAFTFTKNEEGSNMRIPSLGKVIIGDNVEVGMLTNIAVGSAGDTVIDDYVKLDAYIHVAHDVHLMENVELPAGTILGGFVTLEKNVFIGINASLRNRITIGENSIVGMGSVVTKNVEANTVVVGVPARKIK